MSIATTTHHAGHSSGHAAGHTADLPTLLEELRATRARAQSALAELRLAQYESEARAAARRGRGPDAGGGDTYKRVAGVSSLERAADAAERIIASADRQIAALSPMLEVTSVAKPWARAR